MCFRKNPSNAPLYSVGLEEVIYLDKIQQNNKNIVEH